ncbi:hypothetical protein VUR80DRAFT_1403 [Thermomyces stellatus]
MCFGPVRGSRRGLHQNARRVGFASYGEWKAAFPVAGVPTNASCHFFFCLWPLILYGPSGSNWFMFVMVLVEMPDRALCRVLDVGTTGRTCGLSDLGVRLTEGEFQSAPAKGIMTLLRFTQLPQTWVFNPTTGPLRPIRPRLGASNGPRPRRSRLSQAGSQPRATPHIYSTWCPAVGDPPSTLTAAGTPVAVATATTLDSRLQVFQE